MDAAPVVCVACSTENRTGRRFCRACGAPLGSTCPVCGASNEPEDRYCGACGSSLGEESERRSSGAGRDKIGPPTAASSAPSSDRPTERRRVTVLFVDLVGFTPFSEERDPEAVREMLGRYFEVARERVDRYGGAVEKFIGDAVMAVWGTPVAHEDDAERAVRAALEIIGAVADLPVTAGEGRGLTARAAVLTGEAAVDPTAVGEGMVTGDLVNTASRLQSLAPPATVLVDEATARATDQAIVYEPIGEQVLRGKQAPISALRAVRVVAGRRGSGRAIRLEAPFVGRDDELRLVKELFHATARDRRPRLISIVGVAGIGKTRLAWELEKYIDGLVETVYWHAGRSPAHGQGLAFWALAEMIRGRAGIVDGDDPATARGKLADMTARFVADPRERARVEPRIASLLGLEPAPPGGREEQFAAWRALFERVSELGPTVLVFEDLHWADPGLLDFIEALLAGTRSQPILIIALARPELLESHPAFGAKVRNHSRLDLPPLADEAMELLLVGLAPGIPAAAVKAIRERAEGIPLYAVETVRMLLDQGRLTETDGRFRLASELGPLSVPGSLQSLLGARLDALDDDARELIGYASVLGVVFTVDGLVALGPWSREDVARELDDLVGREILVLEDDPRSSELGQYRFAQGVLRDVAYGRLSRRERLARHLAAADHYAALGGDDLAGVIAAHTLDAYRSAPDDADRNALAERARATLEASATRATSIGAHGTAAEHLGEALALATTDDDRVRIQEARGWALASAGRPEEAAATAREVHRMGMDRDDAALRARAGLILGIALIDAGEPRAAWTEIESVSRSLGPNADRDPDAVRLTAELARAMLMSGDPAAAGELIETTLPLAERLGLRSVVAELLPSRAWAIVADGRRLEATALLRGSLELARRERLFNAEMRTRMNLSGFLMAEDPAEGLVVAWEGAMEALERGYTGWAMSAAGNACDAAFLVGQWDRVESMAARLGVLDDEWRPWFHALPANVAAVRAYRGDAAGARELVDRFDRFFGESVDPQIRRGALTTRSFLAHAAGDLVGALRQRRAAEHLAIELGFGRDFGLGTIIAIEAGDLDSIRGVVPSVEATEGLGRVDVHWRALASGAATVMAGDRTGLDGIDAAADGFRDDRVLFPLALTLRARWMLAPDDPASSVAAAEALEILDRLGAVTLRRGLPDFASAETEAEPGLIPSPERAIIGGTPSRPGPPPDR